VTTLNIPINYDLLKDTCLADISDFGKLPGFSTVNTQDGAYYFKDNGADVLAVAHLDSVQDTKHFHLIDVKNKWYVLNAQLDDRLGAYTILHLLPSLGLKYDILLTEGEEIGLSTAAHFQTEKQYNWMFSFDRHGDDVVMYQYDSKFGRRKLKEADLRPAYGSFSDIAFLDHLHCMGFNIGCGYDNEHSAWAIMNVEQYVDQTRKFIKFYNLFKDLHFRYTAKPATYYYKAGTRGAVVGAEWQGYDKWEDEATRNNDWFYKNHTWDSKTARYIYTPQAKQLPAPTDDEAFVKYAMDYEVCEICGLPPKDPDQSVYFGAQMVCETCMTHAAMCDICSSVVRDDTLIDGACRDCQAEINASLDDKIL
jgi:hypothetical protein